MVKNKRIKKNWTNEDLSILIWVVAKYCQSNLIKDVYYGIVSITLMLERIRLVAHFRNDPIIHWRKLHVQMAEFEKDQKGGPSVEKKVRGNLDGVG